MEFLVKVNSRSDRVAFVFGKESDVALLDRWKEIVHGKDNPRAQDAKEFAALSAKRWRYYSDGKLSVTDLGELQGAIKSDPDGEYAFILLANATWQREQPTLGMCFCRRTWANHLVVDFLSTHPDVIGAVPEKVERVGTGMLLGLAHLAAVIKARRIWGEATADSAAFYHRLLGRPVRDVFSIQGSNLERLRLEFQSLRPPASMRQTEPD
ncbi:MAG: hypothetical protein WCS99_10835 [Limisphaerales bacterium]